LTAWKSKSAALGAVAVVFALAVLAAKTGEQDAARAPRPEEQYDVLISESRIALCHFLTEEKPNPRIKPVNLRVTASKLFGSISTSWVSHAAWPQIKIGA
jgi:hypothetical protein